MDQANFISHLYYLVHANSRARTLCLVRLLVLAVVGRLEASSALSSASSTVGSVAPSSTGASEVGAGSGGLGVRLVFGLLLSFDSLAMTLLIVDLDSLPVDGVDKGATEGGVVFHFARGAGERSIVHLYRDEVVVRPDGGLADGRNPLLVLDWVGGERFARKMEHRLGTIVIVP
jgi:hypothetical protein